MRLRALVIASIALALLPVAAALDSFPEQTTMEAEEARLLVRLPQGGTLRVDSDVPVSVALVAPGEPPRSWTTTPAAFAVALGAPEDSWHGLPGTVEIVLRRDDRLQTVRVTLEDGAGAGLEHEWPASAPPAKRSLVPAPPLGAPAAALVGVTFMRRRAQAGACDSK